VTDVSRVPVAMNARSRYVVNMRSQTADSGGARR
jgi:hypothetical protein